MMRYLLVGSFLVSSMCAQTGSPDGVHPALEGRRLLFVVRHQYASDHHSTATLFQTGEINAHKFKGGSSIKVLDLRGKRKVTTLLDVPRGVARDPEISHDGRHVVFSMRKDAKDDYHVYRMNADGSGLTQLTFGAGISDIDPAFLPDGSITFSSTRDYKFCQCNRHIMANLFRMEGDGANVRRIGGNILFEGHPHVMKDGRILYDRWEYVDRQFGPSFGLWTCNPDGTNHALFYGNNAWSPGMIADARMIPGTPWFIATYGSCHDRPWGALAIVDRTRGMDGTTPILHSWPGDLTPFLQSADVTDARHRRSGRIDAFKRIAAKYEDPFPLSKTHFLCSRQIAGEETGIFLVGTDGTDVLVHREAPGCFDAMLLEPSARPAALSSRSDLSQNEGFFYVMDVYRGTGMETVERGTIKSLRVVEAPVKRFWTQPHWGIDATQAPAMNWNLTNNKRILGTVPVEPDGSAYFTVPADRMVYFQALDANGMMVQSMRSGTMVRPGETLGCVGCHERRQTAAPNDYRPQALRRGPSSLTDWYGAERDFNYLTEVQPVFDRHCTACHDHGKDAGSVLNLCGDLGLVFNTSYLELRRLSPVRWQPDRAADVKPLVRAVDDGPPQVLPAFAWGSHRSRLVDVIRNEHYGVELTKEEHDRIITWIDLNAPYYGSYASAYPGNPFGRSPLTGKELRRLEKLTGAKLVGGNTGSEMRGSQVDFTRPQESACLLGIPDGDDARRVAAQKIIETGLRRLRDRPRADMPGFVPAEEDRRRDAKAEALLRAEKESRRAMVEGRRYYGDRPPAEPRRTRHQESVRSDWTGAATLKTIAGSAAKLTTVADAAGGCDGIKDGRWGFHTGHDDQPWWHVDLGRPHRLDHVLVFNRCDGHVAARASRLVLSTSLDGRSWKQRYRHLGEIFFGATDKKPLHIALDGVTARHVRIALPEANTYLHLDEVEVYATTDEKVNLALGRTADQSSSSRWSHASPRATMADAAAATIRRGLQMAAELRRAGVPVDAAERTLRELGERLAAASPDDQQDGTYLAVRSVVRTLVLADPLLDFDDLLFVKRVPGSYSHMSDQYYGWWSRPGGGIYVLRDWKSDTPRLECLTTSLPEGSFLRPDLSYDGKRIAFAYARHHAGVRAAPDKVDKDKLPEDAFYHVYEMNVDGSGLRRLTRGRYDDFDARYLPNGDIVFLSTRRGQFFQCGKDSAESTRSATLPDGYVRCGGDARRPVAVYTLHVMAPDGSSLRQISPFEMFEWTPAVDHDGTILYSRWDYVDRDNMPYMGLWSTAPDGTGARLRYGNHTRTPHCIFEARPVPGSRQIVFVASGHHSITGGSLVLLDPARGTEGEDPLTRLTPQVCFPEVEGWPDTWFANPWPLSERTFLVAWSNLPLAREGRTNPPNALGLNLFHASGHREPIYRDPDISSMYPIPLRPRPRPPSLPDRVRWDGPQEGRFLVQDVYQGLEGVTHGTVKRLRVVGVPVKTQPNMNRPVLGVTRDDPGKCVLGTVPVEADGSAWFRVPSGVSMFFQALDAQGMAVQTMRSATYVQPGETASCIGCHESRRHPPRTTAVPAAVQRPPSRITVGPEGSWPIRFDRLVQPVLEQHCVRCHEPGAEAEKFDLSSSAAAYGALVAFGRPSLTDQVMERYREGASTVGSCIAKRSKLLAFLQRGDGHAGVRLNPDTLERLTTWMDTYAQRRGAFSPDQERHLQALRRKWSDLLIERR